MPEEWTVKDASEKKRKAEENHDRGPGRPRRAERSTGEENNNLRLVEGGRGGGGEEDLEESGGEESQESGSEEALKHSLTRSKTGHARDPDHDQGPTGRGFLLRDGTGRVIAKKVGYRDGSGRVVRKF